MPNEEEKNEDLTLVEQPTDISNLLISVQCPRFHLTTISCCCVSCSALGKCQVEQMFSNVCDPREIPEPKWVRTCSAKKAMEGKLDEKKEGECGSSSGISRGIDDLTPGSIIFLNGIPE